MPTPGQLPGKYNLVLKEEYELFDHTVPIERFETMLRESEIPDELCVVGLEGIFGDDDRVTELSRLMDRRANALESRQNLPTIQFAIDGSFQRLERDFEIEVDEDLYRLSRLFGSQISREQSGWLTSPF